MHYRSEQHPAYCRSCGLAKPPPRQTHPQQPYFRTASLVHQVNLSNKSRRIIYQKGYDYTWLGLLRRNQVEIMFLSAIPAQIAALRFIGAFPKTAMGQAL
jgi:hypothetical protein